MFSSRFNMIDSNNSTALNTAEESSTDSQSAQDSYDNEHQQNLARAERIAIKYYTFHTRLLISAASIPYNDLNLQINTMPEMIDGHGSESALPLDANGHNLYETVRWHQWKKYRA